MRLGVRLGLGVRLLLVRLVHVLLLRVELLLEVVLFLRWRWCTSWLVLLVRVLELVLLLMVGSLAEVGLVYLRCDVHLLWLVVRRLLMMMCSAVGTIPGRVPRNTTCTMLTTGPFIVTPCLLLIVMLLLVFQI